MKYKILFEFEYTLGKRYSMFYLLPSLNITLMYSDKHKTLSIGLCFLIFSINIPIMYGKDLSQ